MVPRSLGKEEEGKEENSPKPRTGPLIYPSSRDQQGSLPRFWSTVSLRVTGMALAQNQV